MLNISYNASPRKPEKLIHITISWIFFQHIPYSPTAIPHDLDSVDGPEHPVPQALPAIQDRDRVCVPDPHRVEQAPHAPYPVHRELTGI